VSRLEVEGKNVQEVKLECDNLSGLKVSAENIQGVKLLRFAGALRKNLHSGS